MILSELTKDFMCFCFPFYFSLFYWEIGNKTVTCLHKSVSKENNKILIVIRILTNHHPPQTTNKLKDFKNFLYCVNYSFFFFLVLRIYQMKLVWGMNLAETPANFHFCCKCCRILLSEKR